MRDNITFFRSFYDSAQKMNEVDRLAFYDAILGYSLYDIEPILTGNASLVFTAIRPILDESVRLRDIRTARAEGGLKGGRPPKKNLTENLDKNLPQNLNENPNRKGEDSNVKESNVKEDIKVADAPVSVKRFVKPSINEIAAYCKERGNDIDAAAFFDYYESKGWKVGGNPMKDWKAAVRNWERMAIDRRGINRKAIGNRGDIPRDPSEFLKDGGFKV